jgi:V8-like Glu-specific endopeptidase
VEINTFVEDGGGLHPINVCSGVLIGKSMVLSAASCFNYFWSGDSDTRANVRARISRYHDDGSWSCLHDPAINGKCTYEASVVVRRQANPSVKRDIAAVFPGYHGVEFENANAAGVHTWGLETAPVKAGDAYTQLGRGYSAWVGSSPGNPGVMREFNDTIDWVSDYYFITHSPISKYVCDGDRGGPYVNPDGYLIGIQSSFDTEPRAYCSTWNSKVRATRITKSKVDVINKWRSEHSLRWCQEKTNDPSRYLCD